jgi:uncharacterized protein
MIERISVFFVRFVSAFFRTFGGRACRFHPSCSDYSVEALGRFGWSKAVRLSFSRLFRCHPFSLGGWDPLPAVRQAGRKEA